MLDGVEATFVPGDPPRKGWLALWRADHDVPDAHDELDADPFSLLALRGRSRSEILEALRALRSTPTGEASRTVLEEEKDMRASEAWRRSLGPLPSLSPSRPRPGIPAVWPSDPPDSAPFSAEGLQRLAIDAATRAWAAYQGEETAGLRDDHDTDLIRWAVSTLDTEEWAVVAEASGENPRRLARWARAWEMAGSPGVRVATERTWRPDPGVMATARQALLDAGVLAPRLRVRLNTLSVDDTQIRLGSDGNWWRFQRRGGAWELDSPPASDPDDLLTVLD